MGGFTLALGEAVPVLKVYILVEGGKEEIDKFHLHHQLIADVGKYYQGNKLSDRAYLS